MGILFFIAVICTFSIISFISMQNFDEDKQFCECIKKEIDEVTDDRIY